MPHSSPKKDAYATLRLAPFRSFLLARLCIVVAIQIQVVAVGWQIYGLTHDPLYLGLIGLAEAVPAIGVALVAGHFADVHDRKKILVYSSVVSFICMLALYLLSWDSVQPMLRLNPWPLYAVVFVGGLTRGFFGPAASAIVSEIVPRQHYGNSSAWNSSIWHGSSIIGPAISGLLYGFYGAPSAYLSAVLCTFAGIIFIARITPPPHRKKSSESNIYRSISEGVRFVFNHQIILAAMAMDLFAVLFGGAVALLPIFAAEILHVGPQGLGLLRAAPGLGSLLVAIYLAFRPVTRRAGPAFFLNVIGFGICMIVFGLSTSFLFSLAVLALSGVFDGVSVFIRGTTYQFLTPNAMRGRVSAVNYIFLGSSNEIGEFESGVMAKLMGTVPSVVFGGVMTLAVVAFAFVKAPKLRTLDLSPEKNATEA